MQIIVLAVVALLSDLPSDVLHSWKALIKRLEEAPVGYQVEVAHLELDYAAFPEAPPEAVGILLGTRAPEDWDGAMEPVAAAFERLFSGEDVPGVVSFEGSRCRVTRLGSTVLNESLFVGPATSHARTDKFSVAYHSNLDQITFDWANPHVGMFLPLELVQPSPSFEFVDSWLDGAWKRVAAATYRRSFGAAGSDRAYTVRLGAGGVPVGLWLQRPGLENSVILGLFRWHTPDEGGVQLVESLCMEQQGERMAIRRYRVAGWVEPVEPSRAVFKIDTPLSFIDLRRGRPETVPKFSWLPRSVRELFVIAPK